MTEAFEKRQLEQSELLRRKLRKNRLDDLPAISRNGCSLGVWIGMGAVKSGFEWRLLFFHAPWTRSQVIDGSAAREHNQPGER